jgi:hypothetical protein
MAPALTPEFIDLVERVNNDDIALYNHYTLRLKPIRGKGDPILTPAGWQTPVPAAFYCAGVKNDGL